MHRERRFGSTGKCFALFFNRRRLLKAQVLVFMFSAVSEVNCVYIQVLRSLAPSKTIECTHFCGEYIFYWAMQNGRPCLIASNMAAPWRKVIGYFIKSLSARGLPYWMQSGRGGHFAWPSRKYIPQQKWVHLIVMLGAKLRSTCLINNHRSTA